MSSYFGVNTWLGPVQEVAEFVVSKAMPLILVFWLDIGGQVTPRRIL